MRTSGVFRRHASYHSGPKILLMKSARETEFELSNPPSRIVRRNLRFRRVQSDVATTILGANQSVSVRVFYVRSPPTAAVGRARANRRPRLETPDRPARRHRAGSIARSRVVLSTRRRRPARLRGTGAVDASNPHNVRLVAAGSCMGGFRTPAPCPDARPELAGIRKPSSFRSSARDTLLLVSCHSRI